jgi:class 3 adenylate cyclase
MSFGESFAVVREHNTELVSGEAAAASDRILATVMFEDMVGSVTALWARFPAVAVRCAGHLHEVVGALGLEARVGTHTGECERIGTDLSGMAVRVAARIGAAAAPGETVVSRTVSDLAGSGLNFVLLFIGNPTY